MIVTHTNPDWDAIASVWLLRKYGGLESNEVKFVNTGNPDPALIEAAAAVVDTGKQLDPARLRFDHHQLPGAASNDTCAARQVWEHLRDEGRDVGHLTPLIDLIFCGDTGREDSGAAWSRDVGLHALLSGYKLLFSEMVKPVPDDLVLLTGFGILNALDARLKNQVRIKAELADKVVYKSPDGLLWAIRYGSAGSTFAAFEAGARLVVFEGEPLEVEGGLTYPVGIMRAGEWQEPHTGELVQVALDTLEGGEPAYHEMAYWFRHPAGFFAGRGTAKAPVFDPVVVDLVILANLIDSVWER